MPKPVLKLVSVLDDGSLSPSPTFVRPSFPCPVVQLSEITVEKINHNDEGFLVCDIHIAGEVRSSFSDVVPGKRGTIDNVDFVINGDDKPYKKIALSVKKTHIKGAAKPFPYSGTFDTVIENIPITEGNNTFEFIAYEPSTKMEGSSFWAISFSGDYIETDDGDYKLGPKGFTAERPHLIHQGTEPELHLYTCIVYNLDASQEGMNLVIGDSTPVISELKKAKDQDYHVAVRDDDEILQFCFLPPPLGAGKKVDDTAASKALGDSFVMPGQDRANFFIGFYIGYYIAGIRLETGNSRSVQAIDLSNQTAIPRLNAHITLSSSILAHTDVALINRGAMSIQSDALLKEESICNLFAAIDTKLRESKKAKFDVVIALLSSDYESLGVTWKISDWRESFISVISGVLVDSLIDEDLKLPIQRGYVAGRFLNESMRGTLDPRGIDHRAGRGEYLLNLPILSYFFRNNRIGANALKKNSGLISGLTGTEVNTSIPDKSGY